jgi:hypothetical protein
MVMRELCDRAVGKQQAAQRQCDEQGKMDEQAFQDGLRVVVISIQLAPPIQ